MQKQVNGEANITNRPSHKQSRTRTRAFWLRVSRSGGALLIVLVSVVILAQLVLYHKTYATALKHTNMLETSARTAAEGTLQDA